jgi:beta-phosphoglucomutase
MVTADDVPVSKPDPASYQLAHRRLQQPFPQVAGPDRCIAIEDTAAGIRSAKAAGFRVLALTHSHEAQALREADWIVESLEPLDLMHFKKIIRHD